MVVISSPSTVPICLEQERIAFPFSSTVQAPHKRMPQPNLVPVSPRISRRYHSSGISGSPSKDWARPFTFKSTIGHFLARRGLENCASILHARTGELHQSCGAPQAHPVETLFAASLPVAPANSGSSTTAGREVSRRAGELVREEEYAAGKVGLQRGFLIITGQDSVLPREQVGIVAGKLIPVEGGRLTHTLADQKEISVGNRFVVALGIAAPRRVAL